MPLPNFKTVAQSVRELGQL